MVATSEKAHEIGANGEFTRQKNRNGFAEAPSEVGLYYARIRRPEGGGYKQGRDIKVEYHIQKPLPEPEVSYVSP